MGNACSVDSSGTAVAPALPWDKPLKQWNAEEVEVWIKGLGKRVKSYAPKLASGGSVILTWDDSVLQMAGVSDAYVRHCLLICRDEALLKQQKSLLAQDISASELHINDGPMHPVSIKLRPTFGHRSFEASTFQPASPQPNHGGILSPSQLRFAPPPPPAPSSSSMADHELHLDYQLSVETNASTHAPAASDATAAAPPGPHRTDTMPLTLSGLGSQPQAANAASINTTKQTMPGLSPFSSPKVDTPLVTLHPPQITPRFECPLEAFGAVYNMPSLSPLSTPGCSVYAFDAADATAATADAQLVTAGAELATAMPQEDAIQAAKLAHALAHVRELAGGLPYPGDRTAQALETAMLHAAQAVVCRSNISSLVLRAGALLLLLYEYHPALQARGSYLKLVERCRILIESLSQHCLKHRSCNVLPPLLLHGYSDREMHLQLGMCMSELAEQLTGASGLGNNAHVQQPLSLLRSPVVYEDFPGHACVVLDAAGGLGAVIAQPDMHLPPLLTAAGASSHLSHALVLSLLAADNTPGPHAHILQPQLRAFWYDNISPDACVTWDTLWQGLILQQAEVSCSPPDALQAVLGDELTRSRLQHAISRAGCARGTPPPTSPNSCVRVWELRQAFSGQLADVDLASALEALLQAHPQKKARANGSRPGDARHGQDVVVLGASIQDVYSSSSMPARPERFMGRDEDAQTCMSKLANASSAGVLLVGPTGIGKSSLAVDVCVRLMAGGALAGGVLWADMGGVGGSADVALSRLSAAVGAVQMDDDAPLLAVLLAALSKRTADGASVLLVVDSIEDALLHPSLLPQGSKPALKASSSANLEDVEATDTTSKGTAVTVNSPSPQTLSEEPSAFLETLAVLSGKVAGLRLLVASTIPVQLPSSCSLQLAVQHVGPMGPDAAAMLVSACAPILSANGARLAAGVCGGEPLLLQLVGCAISAGVCTAVELAAELDPNSPEATRNSSTATASASASTPPSSTQEPNRQISARQATVLPYLLQRMEITQRHALATLATFPGGFDDESAAAILASDVHAARTILHGLQCNGWLQAVHMPRRMWCMHTAVAIAATAAVIPAAVAPASAATGSGIHPGAEVTGGVPADPWVTDAVMQGRARYLQHQLSLVQTCGELYYRPAEWHTALSLAREASVDILHAARMALHGADVAGIPVGADHAEADGGSGGSSSSALAQSAAAIGAMLFPSTCGVLAAAGAWHAFAAQRCVAIDILQRSGPEHHPRELCCLLVANAAPSIPSGHLQPSSSISPINPNKHHAAAAAASSRSVIEPKPAGLLDCKSDNPEPAAASSSAAAESEPAAPVLFVTQLTHAAFMTHGSAQAALQACVELLGPEHAITAWGYTKAAFCSAEEGMLSQAEDLYQQALNLSTRVLGAGHPDTLACIGGLASCLLGMGKAAEAEALLRQLLETRQHVLGAEHPDAMATLDSLAFCCRQRGQHAEALPLFRSALELRMRVLGADHADTLASLSSCASCLDANPARSEAEEMFCVALNAHMRVLGSEHPASLAALNNLALCLHVRHRFEEAEPLFRSALVSRSSLLGPDHIDTRQTMEQLALCLKSQGRHADSEALYRSAWEGHAKMFGPGHPAALAALNNVALSCQYQGRHAEAEPLFRQAHKVRIEVYGQGHVETLVTLSVLACCLDAQGRHAEAEAFHWQALEGLDRALGPSNQRTQGAKRNLKENLAAQGKGPGGEGPARCASMSPSASSLWGKRPSPGLNLSAAGAAQRTGAGSSSFGGFAAGGMATGMSRDGSRRSVMSELRGADAASSVALTRLNSDLNSGLSVAGAPNLSSAGPSAYDSAAQAAQAASGTGNLVRSLKDSSLHSAASRQGSLASQHGGTDVSASGAHGARGMWQAHAVARSAPSPSRLKPQPDNTREGCCSGALPPFLG